MINKQSPNRQIWWSSPVSGPKRYDYDTDTSRWINTRDKHLLSEILKSEILASTGVTLPDVDGESLT